MVVCKGTLIRRKKRKRENVWMNMRVWNQRDTELIIQGVNVSAIWTGGEDSEQIKRKRVRSVTTWRNSVNYFPILTSKSVDQCPYAREGALNVLLEANYILIDKSSSFQFVTWTQRRVIFKGCMQDDDL